MMASRGMGDISPSKMPKGKKLPRRDDTDFTQYADGGKVGLYANINAKRARGEKMRKPGQKGAPTAQAFIDSAKTAKK
jgi:glutamate mutase epsilon subunit